MQTGIVWTADGLMLPGFGPLAMFKILVEVALSPFKRSPHTRGQPSLRKQKQEEATAKRARSFGGGNSHQSSSSSGVVTQELSRTKEDGTLMYPHLQKFMPPVPSRFVQTRESTQAAISDTYNGDGKVYAALRASAYVSWGIVTSLGAPSETGLRA